MFEKNSDFRKGCARLILQTTPENRERAKTIVSLLSKTDRNNITISLQQPSMLPIFLAFKVPVEK